MRLNLCFNEKNENDLKAFQIINEKKHRTNFVVDAVLFYINSSSTGLSKTQIKEALKEVLIELKIDTKTIESNIEKSIDIDIEQIPDHIFDMFNSL